MLQTWKAIFSVYGYSAIAENIICKNLAIFKVNLFYLEDRESYAMRGVFMYNLI